MISHSFSLVGQTLVDSGAFFSIYDDAPGPKSNWVHYRPTEPGELPGFAGLNGATRVVIGHGVRRAWMRVGAIYYDLQFYSRRTSGSGGSVALASTMCLAEVGVAFQTHPDSAAPSATVACNGCVIELELRGRLWVLPLSAPPPATADIRPFGDPARAHVHFGVPTWKTTAVGVHIACLSGGHFDLPAMAATSFEAVRRSS